MKHPELFKKQESQTEEVKDNKENEEKKKDEALEVMKVQKDKKQKEGFVTPKRRNGRRQDPNKVWQARVQTKKKLILWLRG